MNSNAVIALLVLKNIITQEEGEKVVEYLHDRPQSTVLADSINDIKPLLVPVQALMPQLGPVGPAQREEEIAARTAAATAPPVPAEPAPPVEPAKPEDDKQPATDKPAKDSSVKKSDAKPAKK